MVQGAMFYPVFYNVSNVSADFRTAPHKLRLHHFFIWSKGACWLAGTSKYIFIVAENLVIAGAIYLVSSRSVSSSLEL